MLNATVTLRGEGRSGAARQYRIDPTEAEQFAARFLANGRRLLLNAPAKRLGETERCSPFVILAEDRKAHLRRRKQLMGLALAGSKMAAQQLAEHEPGLSRWWRPERGEMLL
jgi:hypothetical protein